tara:strand:+ start:158 stop:313 length:156 start_codon:yes stop_codon:yes gene_type:complete
VLIISWLQHQPNERWNATKKTKNSMITPQHKDLKHADIIERDISNLAALLT